MARRQQQDAPREQRLARIDRHIAELQLLQGEASAQAFLERLARAEAEQRPERRNLLLDSLVLDLAQAAREHQQQRQRLEHLQDLASEVAAPAPPNTPNCSSAPPPASPTAIRSNSPNSPSDATPSSPPTSSNRPPSPAARPCSRASPASATKSAKAWPPPGRRPAGSSCANPPPRLRPEVGGKADNGRLQLRAVALNANRDSQRDRDIETLWCGEFQRLQALLAAQGGELSVERALGVGKWR